MALYHKYRPATFAEVVGQEHVTEPLMQALDSGRINHAYLFSGPRGTGKTSSARILARSLNCVEGPTSTPCGKCSSCLALAPGGSGNLDVTELDAASHGGVDDARDLRDRAFYAPAESRYRVFIIDEAHMVTSAGFNALLKIVEEPPDHLIFIFATTEPEKVLPTIKSRTHHYPFRLLSPHAMRGLLERICQQEGVKVDPAVYPLVIRAGGGSPRDALSVLDQLLAGSGADGITYHNALTLLGATDVALIDDAVDALAAADRPAMFSTIERVVSAGHDPRRFTSDLLDRFRDLIMLQSVGDAASSGLVDAPDDQLERMVAQAKALGAATATRFADVLSAGLNDMRGATSPRLLLEIMAARMLLPAIDDSYEALLQRVEQLERGVASTDTAREPPAPPDTSHISRAEAAQSAAEGAARARAVIAKRQAQKPSAPAHTPAPSAPEPTRTAPAAPASPSPAPPATEGMTTPAASPAPPATGKENTPVAPEMPAQPADGNAPEPPAPNAGIEATLTTEDFAKQWVAIRNHVHTVSRTLDVMLSAARVIDYRPDTAQLSISHTTGPLVARINQPQHLAMIADAIAHTLDARVQVHCFTEQDVAQGTAAQPAPSAPAPPAPASSAGGAAQPAPTASPPAQPTGSTTPASPGASSALAPSTAPASSTGGAAQPAPAPPAAPESAESAQPPQQPTSDAPISVDTALARLEETLGATLLEDE